MVVIQINRIDKRVYYLSLSVLRGYIYLSEIIESHSEMVLREYRRF